MALTEAMLSGDRIALARLITLVENRKADTAAVMSKVYPSCGRAFTIGITGPPGAGKSTLTNCVITHLRERGKTVGVVAIDPSSPFSGGSVLGDRIRMQTHFLDPGVFIRSLSTRGSHGGLARAGRDVARLFDAFGKDVVIIETVGVGQTELDIMEVADTVVVVLVPEAGDTVQVMKAGLLEIADVFVVNKADREGANRMRTELELMLSLKASEGGHSGGWQVPVLMTQASRCEGTEAVLDSCLAHFEHLADGDRDERRRQRLAAEVLEIFEEELMRRLRGRSQQAPVNTVLADVASGRTDPYRAALDLLADENTLAAILSSQDGGKSS
ncbi:MAG: methylmalonyl Co-A mutase-associated GTPase MeaB [Deltaproteobacteria bacterium]|nr:MAG: methylmalonyl Co-A mutase-associated GTPase MeaB [Deltaproteobacteria bacterium]